jgi:hypothetical protein
MFAEVVDFFSEHVKPVLSTEFQRIRRRGDTGHIVIKNGYEIKSVPAALAEKPARRHAFEDIESFGDYLARHFDPADTEILANLNGIAAISDHAWDRDQVTCTLQTTEKYREWSAVFNKDGFGQKALYAFLRRYRDCIKDAPRILSSLRELEMSSGEGVKLELTETGMAKFVGKQANVEIKGTLPTELVVLLPIYKRSDLVYEFQIDILPTAIPGHGVTFALSVRNLEDVRDQALGDALNTLDERLNRNGSGPFLISRGALNLEG